MCFRCGGELGADVDAVSLSLWAPVVDSPESEYPESCDRWEGEPLSDPLKDPTGEAPPTSSPELLVSSKMGDTSPASTGSWHGRKGICARLGTPEASPKARLRSLLVGLSLLAEAGRQSDCEA